MDSASLIEALSGHPHLEAIASLVRASAVDATLARRADYAARERDGRASALGRGHIPEGLTEEDADTPYGNVLTILERGATDEAQRELLGALLALSIKFSPPADDDATRELATHLVWLAAHTPCDALTPLDAALGADADPLWIAIASLLTETESLPADFGFSEALVAAASLRRSTSDVAREQRSLAAAQVTDPALLALLLPRAEELGGELLGEVQAPPRGPVLTIILALTLLLFLGQLVRVIGRYAFAYRRPAAIRLGPQGLELSQRIELMGRVLRDRATVVPLSNLARVTREVKYSRAGLYVGLSALTLGTYFGTGFFVDGVRVPGGSWPLLGLAVLFVVAGLCVDFVLSTGADALRGRCRVVVVPRTGPTVCVGSLDPQRADSLLSALAERTRTAATLAEPSEKPAEPANSEAAASTRASSSA
ncbi:MAG: hypothetical protein ACOY0T_40310 [Myxococcota bacterium]